VSEGTITRAQALMLFYSMSASPAAATSSIASRSG
jgi:hypothetical protein